MKTIRIGNKRGMSIMGVMVAAGLTGLVALMLASLFRQTNKNTLQAVQANEVDNLRSLARAITRAHNNCGLPSAGAGAIVGAPPSITLDGAGSMTSAPLAIPMLGQNQIVPGNQFRSISLNAIELTGVQRAAGDRGTGNIRLRARKIQRVGASQDVVEDIPVQLQFNSAVDPTVGIVQCMPSDGDVVAAVESHLDANLDPRIRNYIDQNIAQHLDTFVDEQINNDPSTLLRIVNNRVVQASVCSNIKGATWDSENEECNLPSGPTPPTPPAPPTSTDHLEMRFVLTGYGTTCEDAFQKISRKTRYKVGQFMNNWCESKCATVQGAIGGHFTAAWGHGCINPRDRNQNGRILAEQPGVNLPVSAVASSSVSWGLVVQF